MGQGGAYIADQPESRERRMAKQLSIFGAVLNSYLSRPDTALSNSELYQDVARAVGLELGQFEHREPVGHAGQRRSLSARAARWSQQTLKLRGVVERVPGRRGVWRLTEHARQQLHAVTPGPVIVAFSTRLGVAVWADRISGLRALREEVHLVVTSPPYALSPEAMRAYGNPDHASWVNFVVQSVEAVMPVLAPGGSIVLNVGQDTFLRNLPARAILKERLVVALCDKLGLYKIDEIIWENPSRPPGPCQWASKKRFMLNSTYEPLLLFSNDPSRLIADNRRVLEPHSTRHERLMAAGGERTGRESADGAHVVRPGDYGRVTPGRIPRNLVRVSHTCAGQRRYKARARALGLPTHGAPFPEALARFLVQFLSRPGDLCVDFMSGSQTIPAVCEALGRRWYSIDYIAEFLRGGAERFDKDEVWINQDLDRLLGLDQGSQRSLLPPVLGRA